MIIALAVPTGAMASQYSPPWADLICSHYPGSGGLDTETACANAFARLNAAGYHSFNDFNVTGVTAMSTSYAQSDAIWAVFGHGGPGGISTFPTYPNGSAWSNVFSDPSHGTCNVSGSTNACISNYSVSQLHAIRLMLFAGCETAQTNELSWNAYNKGVDSSIGFSQLIYQDHVNVWTDRFFYYAATSGLDEYNAAVAAENDVYAQFGGYGGTNSSVIWGSFTMLKPAGYGS
jgi:hypothetical protein